MKKVSIIVGTRPEAIKLSPVILQMKKCPSLQCHVCVTGQHRQMVDQIFPVFGIVPDIDLNLMRPDQTLAGITARTIEAVDDYLSRYRPDLVLVQGDTTTVFSAALVAFYHRIPVGHVEAGLRTWNKFAPYPEEINRVLTTHLAELHFAPTAWAQKNLVAEGVLPERVFLTGNPVIDALQIAVAEVRRVPPPVPGLPGDLWDTRATVPVVLITGHRRESFGRGFEDICRAIDTLAKRFSEAVFVYPVHLNPHVREPVFRWLGRSANVHLLDPLTYLQFVAMMDRARIVLTDSGGVQEEAPSLGKPVLVMRATTERPEGVEAGAVKLVGTDPACIVEAVSTLLTNTEAYERMAHARNPYGDGQASQRIRETCEEFLGEAA